MEIAEGHDLIGIVHVAPVHRIEDGAERGDIHLILAVQTEGKAFEVGAYLSNVLVVLECQLLDVAAALGEHRDKAILLQALDGFAHRGATAVVVGRKGVLAQLAPGCVLILQDLVPNVFVDLLDDRSSCCHGVPILSLFPKLLKESCPNNQLYCVYPQLGY